MIFRKLITVTHACCTVLSSVKCVDKECSTTIVIRTHYDFHKPKRFFFGIYDKSNTCIFPSQMNNNSNFFLRYQSSCQIYRLTVNAIYGFYFQRYMHLCAI